MYLLDQWFSEKNLKKIFDFEKRKWNHIDKIFDSHYSDVSKRSWEIRDLVKDRSEIYKEIKVRKKSKKNYDDLTRKIKEINQGINDLKEIKEGLIVKILEKVSKNINKKGFWVSLKKEYNKKTKKDVYTINNHESFYCIKQLQYNIHKLYKVKQSDRFSIVSELKWLLDDKIPKKIIKLDIKSFYESIPLDKLLEKIEQDWLLSYFSREILLNINKEYKSLSWNSYGLPRWLWVSAYLSELYMRQFDEKIKNIEWIYYFARYVDDIIIISKKDDVNYKDIIKKELKTLWLSLNNSKYKYIHYPDNTRNSIDYLWYNFKYSSWELFINLSDKKINRYKKKIDLAFKNYNFNTTKSKEAKNLFLKRLRYLSSNIRLLWRKKYVRSWILYSNPLITRNNTSLKELDDYLKLKTKELTSTFLKEKIKDISFYNWFYQKKFYLTKNKRYFTNHNWDNIELKEDQFKKIIKIWKYV